jgi:glycerophosphoryl diester phosphodiesterase
VPTSVGSTTARSWLLASRVGRGLSGPGSALQLPLQRGGVRVVDRRLVDAAHARGLQVHVWTINEPNQMQELIEIGVDGIVTDRIDLLLELLDSE